MLNLTKDQKNKLDCNNYQVDGELGCYYLQCGLDSLKNYARDEKISLDALIRDLLRDGQFYNKEIDESITMI